MSFAVKFYSYDGPDDAINKLKGLTATTKNVSLYSSFDPLAPVFSLDTLLSVNLAEYTFNSKTYLAKITRTVAADNLYVYSGTVDALGTSFLNGCFTDAAQVFSYTPDGNGQVMVDHRAPRASIATRDSGLMTDAKNQGGTYIAINVITPYGSALGERPSPSVKTYIMHENAWYTFCSAFLSWSAEEQQQYGNSIVSVYRVDSDLVFQMGTGKHAGEKVNVTAETQIVLWTASTSWFSFSSGHLEHKEIPIPNSYELYSIDWINHKSISSNVNIPITPSTADALFTVYIQGVGAMTFSPADIGFSGTISQLGALVSYDFVGGTIGATLQVNGAGYSNIFVRSPMSELVPFFTDSSITNYTSLAASAISTIGGLVATAAGVGSGIGIGAAVAGVVGFASQITASKQGSTSVRGGPTGAADLAEDRKNFWSVQEFEYVDLPGFQARYGKPDGRSLTLSSLMGSGYTPGFIQTAGAHLPQKNLPSIIISEAQSQLDAGAWLL